MSTPPQLTAGYPITVTAKGSELFLFFTFKSQYYWLPPGLSSCHHAPWPLSAQASKKGQAWGARVVSGHLQQPHSWHCGARETPLLWAVADPPWGNLKRCCLPSPSHLQAPHTSTYRNFEGEMVEAESWERSLFLLPYWKTQNKRCKHANKPTQFSVSGNLEPLSCCFT